MKNTLKIDDEIIEICREINIEGKSPSEWDLIESDDYFQSSHYIGGWDSTEKAFCFSYYDDADQESWFQINLAEANKIQRNEEIEVTLRKPDYWIERAKELGGK